MVLRCLKSTDASPVLDYWLLASDGLGYVLLLSLNVDNTGLREPLKAKMASISVEGEESNWEFYLEMLIASLNSLIFSSLFLSSLHFYLAADFYSFTSVSSFTLHDCNEKVAERSRSGPFLLHGAVGGI